MALQILFLLKTFAAIAIASNPDSRTIAMADTPAAVAGAQIVGVGFNYYFLIKFIGYVILIRDDMAIHSLWLTAK